MVIVATRIHWRNVALLCIKEPLQCVACAMDVSQIMLCSCNILSLLHSVTTLCSILLNVCSSLISADKRRELIVSLAVSVVREYDILFDDCSNIFFSHTLSVKYLNNDISLTQWNVLCFVNSHCVQVVDIVLCIIVHRRCTLILLSCHPCLLSGLTILLSKCFKVCASL